MTNLVVRAGGGAIMVAILLIFGYLFYVVTPFLLPGSIGESRDYALIERSPLMVDVSENGEIFVRLSDTGILEFYDSASGSAVAGFNLGRPLKAAKRAYPSVDLYALVDSQDQMLFVQIQYQVAFVDNVRTITPKISFAFDNSILALGDHDHWDIQWGDTGLSLALVKNQQVTIQSFPNLKRDQPPGAAQSTQITLPCPAGQVYLGPRNEWLLALSDGGEAEIYDLRGVDGPSLVLSKDLTPDGVDISSTLSLLGRYSLIAGYDDGRLLQWMMFNSEQGLQLEPIRQFDLASTATRLIPEPRRKGFAALDQSGTLTLLYPTSGQVIAERRVDLDPTLPMVISPRSDLLLAAGGDGKVVAHPLENDHPEISFSSLWQEVWYEGYDRPVFSWQSSSADTDFEPKFSLVPLAFGTIKAAFYALLFAIPLAIGGALYTAYFMAPEMRAWVKPGVEIMAALPTVILGFIGGLWLAPIIENNLTGFLSLFIILAINLALFALLWRLAPTDIRVRSTGWYALLAIPLVALSIALAMQSGPWLEALIFGGDSRDWFRRVLGLDYDQRNALVVGIIMGLAVIPTIFAIAEDAVYSVPGHLVRGSLALGATRWQTLVRVVLLTASPGIFSAVMIGMGRAVGETMIVLMATGNTPLMDFNIFEGMRTFAANIAVELPESEVGSSHYRLLFLTALVLFVFTFVLNSIAELVRQHLRGRYGNL